MKIKLEVELDTQDVKDTEIVYKIVQLFEEIQQRLEENEDG